MSSATHLPFCSDINLINCNLQLEPMDARGIPANFSRKHRFVIRIILLVSIEIIPFFGIEKELWFGTMVKP